MTYRVYYGDPAAVTSREPHLDERVQTERYSTEFEAMRRARELIEADLTTAVAVHDTAGNRLSGLRLQLRLGYCCE